MSADGSILTINPGTTTTRLGLFQIAGDAVECVSETTIEHDENQMAAFASIVSGALTPPS